MNVEVYNWLKNSNTRFIYNAKKSSVKGIASPQPGQQSTRGQEPKGKSNWPSRQSGCLKMKRR